QSRPDRNQYVKVIWPNVRPDQEIQFQIEPAHLINTAGIPYDLGSVMHYRSKAYSKSDGLITIETLNPFFQRTIGQRDQLSFNDKRLINKLYCS
uniref:Metalloendopeptidase n=1 Tax=Romanomermis culicivorax TaxID=13658 RepID=A0A915KBG0_ROMCU